MRIALYIIVMAGVTYLIRMLPFTFFRREIKSRTLRSFLYYIPYAVLAAMTVPAIFYSTGNAVTAAAGTAAALIMSWFDLPLIAVALTAAGTAFVTGLII